MTVRRRWFEHVHKFGGALSLMMAVVALVSGLWQANAPNWMWIVLLAWWVVLAAAVAVLESRVGALDTYQAIWGPDPDLPGNRRKPIGMAVKRRPFRRE